MSNTNNFIVQDSGKRESFGTGAVRDTEAGKPRYDLIPIPLLDYLANEYAKGDKTFRPDLIPHALFSRLGRHLGKGAVKYGDRNWEKGIPTDRLRSSCFRHFMANRKGDRTEDHKAAQVFNIAAEMHFEEIGGNPADAQPNTSSSPSPYRYFRVEMRDYVDLIWRVSATTVECATVGDIRVPRWSRSGWPTWEALNSRFGGALYETDDDGNRRR